jgi:hypothetical protein
MDLLLPTSVQCRFHKNPHSGAGFRSDSAK